jgi:outer membrane biosynthesis protein TonB
MKLPVKSVAWLLPLLLTGCFHKASQPPVQPLAPPIENVPQPAPAPTEPLPPVATVPVPTQVPDTSAQPKTAPKQPVRRKKSAPPASATQQASSVSAIGQLSSGGASDLRQQTVNSITATERGLNGITRGLSSQEQKTAAQIREFLKQARVALNSGNVDGAHTLAVKAKVLLGELSR